MLMMRNRLTDPKAVNRSIILVWIAVFSIFLLTASAFSQDLPPNEDIPFTQKTIELLDAQEMNKIRISLQQGRRQLIGDEPLTIVYELQYPQGATLLETGLSSAAAPVEQISLENGKARRFEADKEMMQQEVTLTIRLSSDTHLGDYVLPPLRVRLRFDYLAATSEAGEERIFLSEPVTLRKVPIYIVLHQPFDECVLGQPLPIVFEIHAEKEVRLLNEFLDNEAVKNELSSLDTYRPEPASVLSRRRQVALSDTFKVISWTYEVTLHEFSDHSVEVEAPLVAWQSSKEMNAAAGQPLSTFLSDQSVSREYSLSNDALSKGIGFLQPEPLRLKVRALSSEQDDFLPLKLIEKISDRQKLRFLMLPLAALLFCLVVLCWLLVSLIRKTLQTGPASKEESAAPLDQPFTHSNARERDSLQKRMTEYRARFEEKPDRESCILLFKLLVESAASRLDAMRALNKREVYAMTAEELLELAGQSWETEELRLLQKQLEQNSYYPLSGKVP